MLLTAVLHARTEIMKIIQQRSEKKLTYRSHDGADHDRYDPAEVHGQPGEQRYDQRQQEKLFRPQQQQQTARATAANTARR